MRARAVGVAALAAGSALAGVLLDWPELAAIGVALLALACAPLAMPGPRSGRWWDDAAPTRVVRGDSATVVVGVELGRGSSRWVSAVDARGTDRVWVPPAASAWPTLLAWPVDTSRRGLFAVGPSRLERGDPFGLSRRVLATRTPSPVLVVPRVHSVDTRALLAARDGGDDERAGSEHFHSLREYVVGDPQKMIHWRSSARAGKLMVRRMVDTTVPWLLVVLDVDARAYDRDGAIFADLDAPAFEESVDTAASWAWWACGPQQRVILTTTEAVATSVEVTARTRDSALDWLAVVATLPDEACGPARVLALARRQGMGRVVLVTGRRTDVSAGWVAAWRQVLPVHVIVGHR